MKEVRIGIVGLGAIGQVHSKYLTEGNVVGGVLSAVAEANSATRERYAQDCSSSVAIFDDYKEMIDSGKIDAVIICVPHYFHSPIAIYAFQKGVHVISEKPAGVYTKQVEEMNQAAQASGCAFSMMFNNRTNPLYIKVKSLLESGELGQVQRLTWIVTAWFRTQFYYNSGGWRGTWKGEGGGVLMNQCPHNLDLIQWMIGVPDKVTAFCRLGQYHETEVEDDVTIYGEYADGKTLSLITSTGELPGSNRLEICATKGKLVVEDNVLTYWKLQGDSSEFCKTSQEMFGKLPFTMEKFQKSDYPEINGHQTITQNFVNHILSGEPLIAPGEEGINSVMMANAAYLSSWTNTTVALPIDGDDYLERLNQK